MIKHQIETFKLVSQGLSLDEVAYCLNVTKGAIYYSIKRLKLKQHRFELDKRAYLTMRDYERIKKLKEEAAERESEERERRP